VQLHDRHEEIQAIPPGTVLRNGAFSLLACHTTLMPEDSHPDNDEYGTPTKGPFGITPMIDENTQDLILAPLNRKPLQHLFAGPRFLRNKDDIRLFSISLPPKKAL
jgi:hypothetical protein